MVSQQSPRNTVFMFLQGKQTGFVLHCLHYCKVNKLVLHCNVYIIARLTHLFCTALFTLLQDKQTCFVLLFQIHGFFQY